MRTTSSIETMNSWIQKIFHPKPHIFKFIENLRMHESCMSTELYGLPLLDENMKDQKFWPRVRPEDQIREDNIRLGIHRLQNGHISIDAFLGKSFSAVGSYYKLSSEKLLYQFKCVYLLYSKNKSYTNKRQEQNIEEAFKEATSLTLSHNSDRSRPN